MHHGRTALTSQGKKLISKINVANEKFNKIIEQKIYNSSQIDELIDIISSYLEGTNSISKIRRRFDIKNKNTFNHLPSAHKKTGLKPVISTLILL